MRALSDPRKWTCFPALMDVLPRLFFEAISKRPILVEKMDVRPRLLGRFPGLLKLRQRKWTCFPLLYGRASPPFVLPCRENGRASPCPISLLEKDILFLVIRMLPEAGKALLHCCLMFFQNRILPHVLFRVAVDYLVRRSLRRPH